MKKCICIKGFHYRYHYAYDKVYYYEERHSIGLYKVFFGVGDEYNFMLPAFFNEHFIDNNTMRQIKLKKLRESLFSI
jgi:hypothetical protein